MKTQSLAATIVLLCTIHLGAQDLCRYVTLTTTNGVSTNSISVLGNETGELVSTWPMYFYANGPQPIINIVKDGIQFPAFAAGVPVTSYATTAVGATVAGPAQFVFGPGAAGSPCIMTVKITPTTYDVNKTTILPPSTNQVYVTLQCSTNLASWIDCTNGIYGNPVTAEFFRIRMGSVTP
jgi:hypothetical protein